MKTWGLEPNHIATLNKLLFVPLKMLGARIWVFGSRARGDHQKFSDLDVLFEASNPIALSEVSKINEALEESSLPIKIDLVDFYNLAEAYKPNIMRERILVDPPT